MTNPLASWLLVVLLAASSYACASIEKIAEYAPPRAAILTAPPPGYPIHLAPGSEAVVTLPALCLDFSRKIPQRSSSFKGAPQEAPARAAKLLRLHNRMLAEAAYRELVASTADLAVLASEQHTLMSSSGARKVVNTPFSSALHEALQVALWSSDPAFVHKRRVAHGKSEAILGKGSNKLDALRQIISQDQSPAARARSARLLTKLELRIAEADLTVRRNRAIDQLAMLMLDAIGEARVVLS